MGYVLAFLTGIFAGVVGGYLWLAYYFAREHL